MTDLPVSPANAGKKLSSWSLARQKLQGMRNLKFDPSSTDDPSDEATPLLFDFESGKLHGEGGFKKYEVDDIVTLNVFLVAKGTVLYNKKLWTETGLMAVIFWSTALILFKFHMDHFENFVGKESNIRAFLSMFSTLIGLLLSFYTALNLGRWWQIRLELRQIIEGCKTLTMYLAASVTTDSEVLGKVQHYCRASIFLLFQLASNKVSPQKEAVRRGYLEQEESDALREMNPHMTFIQAEALWGWMAVIVERLHEQGLTKGAPHFCQMMAAVNSGRHGIAEVQTYLETPIPKGYVHLLCLMVKLHNMILTVMMATLLALRLTQSIKGDQNLGAVTELKGNDVFRVSFRAFFMPFLYNAILYLNAEVCNPLGDDAGDFDFGTFDADIQATSNMLVRSQQTLPPLLKKTEKFKGHTPAYRTP